MPCKSIHKQEFVFAFLNNWARNSKKQFFLPTNTRSAVCSNKMKRDYIVTYTNQKTKKSKAYKDGFMVVDTASGKVYFACDNNFFSSVFYKMKSTNIWIRAFLIRRPMIWTNFSQRHWNLKSTW